MNESWMPSLGDILFIGILTLLCFMLPNFLLGDGSTGWHLAIGHYILDHLQLPQYDLISYTFSNKASVNYEWLFDLLIAFLDRVGGIRLVALISATAIAWLSLLLYDNCRRTGCHYMLVLTLCVLSVPVMAIHWLVRPHLITFFGVLIFTSSLDAFYKQRIGAKKLWAYLGLTMLAWVNCHPAFLMGLAILSIYLISELVIAFVSDGEAHHNALSRVRIIATALGITGIATLINPYGPHLYQYIASYLQQSKVIAATDEFMSPVFHGAIQPSCLELLYFSLIVGLAMASQKVLLPRLLVVLAYAHLALAGTRNMPLFVLVALPFIAELLASAKPFSLLGSAKIEPNVFCRKLTDFYQSSGKLVNDMETKCNKHALPIATVLVLVLSCLNGGKAFGVELIQSTFDPANKPENTLKCIRENKLKPEQGFTYDNWGGYIRYKTGMRVFIDDRVDFYGEPFYLDYACAATVQPEWQDVLNEYGIQWILFPKNSVLVAHLQKEPGWQLLCEDAAGCLYVRRNKEHQ